MQPTTDTVEIPRAEYEKLKALEDLEELDLVLLKKIIKALRNFKDGKFREWN